MIDILVPVLGRPANAEPLARSITASTATAFTCTFLCSPGDDAQIEAALQTHFDVVVVPWEAGPADYAKKINYGVTLTHYPWILMGADDLEFHDGWAHEALRVAIETGKRVIATNDMSNPEVMRGRHATHPLVARTYIEECGTIDGEGFYCELYDHQCVDVEATETAKARDEFAFAQRSVVKHLHPIYNRHIKMDATYEKALRNGAQDRDLFHSRRHLWNPGYRKRRRAR